MRTMHMIGVAHLDPVWLWDWREGTQANEATMLSALDRLAEFDDFVFTSTSAQFYEWIEQTEPCLFEKIRARIKEGRWVICGGWWIQPDCNLPCGESFARQALLAQRYFYEKFGVTAKTGMCPDSFGHNAILPQILKKSGMDNYVFMRPSPEEKDDLPGRTFLWQSPDGSRVCAYQIPIKYNICDLKRRGVLMEDTYNQIKDEPPCGNGDMMAFYGVGDHGGGPTKEHIRRIREYRKTVSGEIDISFSTPDRFFEKQDWEKLPVYAGELQYHAPGCYAAGSMIKKENRRAENALLRAEKFVSAADSLGKFAPQEDLNTAWKQVLFNQFHDTLAGSACPEAYLDARDQLGEAVSLASRAENRALRALAFHIDIPYQEGNLPFVVFNPHSFPVTAPVEIEAGMFFTLHLPEHIRLLDSEGKEVPYQYVDFHARTWLRRRFVFMAQVPPLGYACYHITEGEKPQSLQKLQTPVLENDLLRVEFDLSRGTVKSILHKVSGKYILNNPARAVVYKDDTDTWGHTLKAFTEEVGEFKNAEVFYLDSGSERSSIRFRSRFGESILTQTYTLYAGQEQIHVDCEVDWRGKQQALKLEFAVEDENCKALTEIPFGCIEKKTEGREEAMQSWLDLSGKNCGLSIANDGKYSVNFRKNVIGMTVLRSPVYMHHDPYVLEKDTDYPYMDGGVQSFSYVLCPHTGDWREADIQKTALLLNQPLVTSFETFHKGELPQKKSFLSVSGEGVLLSALKPAYDGEGKILRLYEALGSPRTAEISFADCTFTATFGANEVKTFLLKKGGSVREVNLLEWEG